MDPSPPLLPQSLPPPLREGGRGGGTDNYYSSSGPVKELIKKLGKKSFKKKILGIFVKKEIALEEEVLYHNSVVVNFKY